MDLITEVVLKTVRDVSGSVSEISLDSSLSEMRINSIKIIQIISKLENELDFELDDEDLVLANFDTPRKTISLLREKYSRVKAA